MSKRLTVEDVVAVLQDASFSAATDNGGGYRVQLCSGGIRVWYEAGPAHWEYENEVHPRYAKALRRVGYSVAPEAHTLFIGEGAGNP